MPVNGLLLTLTKDESLVNESLLAIADRGGVELGDRTGIWQPVVVETDDTGGSHDVHEWLQELPGVMMVDVVFTSVGDADEGDADFTDDQSKQAHLQEQFEQVRKVNGLS